MSILKTKVDTLSHSQVLEHASQLMSSGDVEHLVTANALMALEALSDSRLKETCDRASLVVSDSSGLTMAASLLGMPPLTRFPGIDLAFSLCKAAAEKGEGVFLLGGEAGVAERAAQFLREAVPTLKIAGVRHGFFKEENHQEIVDELRRSDARLILVALGMPAQEIWIDQMRGTLPPGLYIGVGGSFDVWAGRVKRAPVWVQRSGFEWLFRLIQEPHRWPRIAQLPRFAALVAAQKLRRKTAD